MFGRCSIHLQHCPHQSQPFSDLQTEPPSNHNRSVVSRRKPVPNYSCCPTCREKPLSNHSRSVVSRRKPVPNQSCRVTCREKPLSNHSRSVISRKPSLVKPSSRPLGVVVVAVLLSPTLMPLASGMVEARELVDMPALVRLVLLVTLYSFFFCFGLYLYLHSTRTHTHSAHNHKP